MLKQLIKYTDFNDAEQEEILYFNLSRTDLMDLIDLEPRLQAWSELTQGGERDLTVPEIKEMLDIVKLLIEKSYGLRSEDGKYFRKSPEIFADFQQTAAYDAFVFWLFEEPDRAISFMLGILPKGLNNEALDTSKKNAEQLMEDMRKQREATVAELPKTESIAHVEEAVPAYIREDRDPTDAELRGMNPDELRAAFQRKMLKN